MTSPDLFSTLLESRSAGRNRVFEELYDENGQIRPHWKILHDALERMPPEEFAQRRAGAQAIIRDNGVTYNVYDESAGQARPWQLDIVPFVVGSADWNVIEAGIKQRAKLANATLADIYGPQRLIAEGHLPAQLVLGHPQFLRPLCGVPPAHGVYLHLYSADLARTPDGNWIVLASRTDAPSGLGYALENRIVVGQTFPDQFAEMRIRRLASFFNGYRESVLSLTHTQKGRSVLLTPGPHNEAYFEHAYLAHYLGFTLVEGDDLLVRDGNVYLKTLTGLEPVSAIFRRVDSDFSDPLELRHDSALGIPGLVEAARCGSVVIANALGGGVMESPAMDAYLPGLARAVLGEELKIPDIPTVWCGTEWGRTEALARLDRVILRNAFDARPLFSRTSSARLGRDLHAADLEVLKEQIARRGATVVAQDLVPLGLAPVLEDGQRTNRPVSLRVFAAWTPQGYIVMPGGLTRVAGNDHARALSMQSGAASKDTWVAGEGTVDRFSLLKDTAKPVDIRRKGEAPPSRAMDNLFWLGRYAERAETLVRILRALILRLGDESGIAEAMAPNLLAPFVQTGTRPAGEVPDHGIALLAQGLRNIVYGRNTANGLHGVLASVRQTAWAVRDRLSLDTWRAIYVLTKRDALPETSRGFDAAEALSYLDIMVRHAAALSGLSAENMTRGPNWLFLDLGRRIERGANLAWLVREMTSASDALETERLRMALEIADSSMTYRSRYLNVFQLAPVIDLLLLDESNPRAVAYQLAAIENNLRELPREPRQGGRNAHPLELATDTRSEIGIYAASAGMPDGNGTRAGLGEFTAGLEQSLWKIADQITDAYFRHAPRRAAAVHREQIS
jgi:uncharacterized circularly permuted ATP-grasp superfamily protein/uncharacterized alpha-E superfamily protein